jgi:hypothetical protein
VDQIVREIKARIAQRHGIDLSATQIQELAARRLEAILDPRGIKPSLLEQLRKSAGTPANIAPAEPSQGFEFEDHTIFDTHSALLRAIRKLLAPVLKLFFNPNPIAHALNTQARLNKDTARREQERERTQAEWNALHYTLVERLVTELARMSIEAQSLAMRVESLSARVDFYERRVRGLENAAPAVPPAAPGLAAAPPRPAGPDIVAAEGGSDSARRRRRRRRGRRGPGAPDGLGAAVTGAVAAQDIGADDESVDEGPLADADSPEAEGEAPEREWAAASEPQAEVGGASTAMGPVSEGQASVAAPLTPAESGQTGTTEGS